MRIIGVDPGLNITGFGIIDKSQGKLKLVSAGAIKTSNRNLLEKRLDKIYSGIIDTLDKHKPDVLVLEEVFTHAKYLSTAISLGYARGIICLAAAKSSMPVKSFAAKRVKKAITGNGAAKKYQVQRMVQITLSLKEAPEPFDVSDALALAIAYSHFT
jgi:crossover junction endodeoxyribonuclease RuvC